MVKRGHVNSALQQPRAPFSTSSHLKSHVAALETWRIFDLFVRSSGWSVSWTWKSWWNSHIPTTFLVNSRCVIYSPNETRQRRPTSSQKLMTFGLATLKHANLQPSRSNPWRHGQSHSQITDVCSINKSYHILELDTCLKFATSALCLQSLMPFWQRTVSLLMACLCVWPQVPLLQHLPDTNSINFMLKHIQIQVSCLCLKFDQ